MATFALSSGTQLVAQRSLGGVNASGDDAIFTAIIQITNAAGGFSCIPRVAAEESGATPASVLYYNVLTNAPIAAGTAITADGIYAVYAPGCRISLVTSAGTATAFVQRVVGRAV